MTAAAKRLWGWLFFDWASQPYSTLLLTFIFGPYIGRLMGSGTEAQSLWGYGIGAAGLVIALGSPILGAIADRSGGRMGFVWLFSLMYVAGAWGLWWAAPDDPNLWFVMASFGLGLIGMEFATTFTNAMMADLGPTDDLGRISGTGFAFGYAGGVVALIAMLALFVETPAGTTLIGIAPVLGLDPAQAEGTRAVGPFTAIWYAVFMIPFFLWVREPRVASPLPIGAAIRTAWPGLRKTLQSLPARPSLFAWLGSSMLYRDALNGMYTFGGIYAIGVLGWTAPQIGVFGILAAVSGAVSSWIGGRADSRFGPKPVIGTCVAVLTLVALGVVFVSRDAVFGLAVGPESRLPDIAFYGLGVLIGAAGGALQAASRTMMVRQSDPARLTEGFGLYALAGKATSFLAPLLIAVATDISGSQRVGVTPLIALFLGGLVLLIWVRPNGERA